MDERCFCHIVDAEGNRYVVKDATARAGIKALESKVEELENSTPTIPDAGEERISDLEGRVDEIEGELEGIDKRISDEVVAELGRRETRIATIEANAEALEERVQDLETLTEEISEAYESLESDVEDIARPIAVEEANRVGARVTSLENNLNNATEELETRVDELEGELEGLDSTIFNTVADEVARRGQLNPKFANSIEECTDTSKMYVLPDGYIYAYMSVTESGKAYTNLANPNDSYWKEGYRISASASGTGYVTQESGCVVTNMINVSASDVVRISGMDLTSNAAKVCICRDANNPQPDGAGVGTKITAFAEATVTSSTTNSVVFTAKKGGYWRFSGILNGASKDIIITVNEEIKETTVTTQKWTNTGHAFVPADYEDRIVHLEDDKQRCNERITILEAQKNDSTSVEVPSFWKDAVDECITKIKALQVGRNCVTFPFFSDNHQRLGYSGILIAKVMKECGIPYCFFGGDAISSAYIETEAEMISQDKAFDDMVSVIPEGKFCRAVGNHDGFWNNYGEKHYYTHDQIYELFLREEGSYQNKVFGHDGTYYYVEDKPSKTRFIVLNTNNDGDTYQITWLQNEALSFNESGWSVVFISHQPITGHYHAETSISLLAIVKNYVISGEQNRATVIGWFSGHIHRDRIYSGVSVNDTDDSEGEAMGFKQVTITSDHTTISYDDATKHVAGNDDLSHAIDFVTINKNTRKVNITRLGIGNDREFTY